MKSIILLSLLLTGCATDVMHDNFVVDISKKFYLNQVQGSALIDIPYRTGVSYSLYQDGKFVVDLVENELIEFSLQRGQYIIDVKSIYGDIVAIIQVRDESVVRKYRVIINDDHIFLLKE